MTIFREPAKPRNRPYKDSEPKWQHDLYQDYENESNNQYSNYRDQPPRRGRGRGRGRFKLVALSKISFSFYLLILVAVVVAVAVVIEINCI